MTTTNPPYQRVGEYLEHDVRLKSLPGIPNQYLRRGHGGDRNLRPKEPRRETRNQVPVDRPIRKVTKRNLAANQGLGKSLEVILDVLDRLHHMFLVLLLSVVSC